MANRGNGSSGIFRFLLLITGGGSAGTQSAGMTSELHKLGMGHLFKWVVGISSGGASGAALVSGQPEVAEQYYRGPVQSSRYVHPFRFWRLLNLDWVANALRRILNVQAVLASPQELYLAATTIDGKQVLLNGKTATPDLVSAIRASAGVCGGGTKVNGRMYWDGVFSDPLPIESLVKQFDPTHILVLMNQRKSKLEGPHRWLDDYLCAGFVGQSGSLTLMKGALHARVRMLQAVKKIEAGETGGVPVAILWPSRIPVSPLGAPEGWMEKASAWSARRLRQIFCRNGANTLQPVA